MHQRVIRDSCRAFARRLQQIIDAERGKIEQKVNILISILLIYTFQSI